MIHFGKGISPASIASQLFLSAWYSYGFRGLKSLKKLEELTRSEGQSCEHEAKFFGPR